MLQYLKQLYKSVSIKKSDLKLCIVTFTKDIHEVPKNQIPFPESLKRKVHPYKLGWITYFSFKTPKYFTSLGDDA